jgi:hypothetical protein
MNRLAFCLALLSLASCGQAAAPTLPPDSFTHPEALYRVAIPYGYAACARGGGAIVAVNEGTQPLGCLNSLGTPSVTNTRYEAGLALEIMPMAPPMPGKSGSVRMRGEPRYYAIAREENGNGERIRILRASRPWQNGVMVLEARQARDFTRDEIERVVSVLVSAEPI